VRCWRRWCDDGGFHILKRLSCHGDHVGNLCGGFCGCGGVVDELAATATATTATRQQRKHIQWGGVLVRCW
jgi:hypothetical protein